MKTALVFICFSACLFAQQKTRFSQIPKQPGFPSACGTSGTQFKVKLKNFPPAPAPPPAGQAQVIFIHDTGDGGDSTLIRGVYPTSKYAIDGSWAGANHGDSWFAVPVTPGEHHVCADLQSSIVGQRTELAHFTAVPGQTYYFRTRLLMSRQIELLELEPIDSDQGSYLTRVYPLSASTAKK